MDGWMGNVMGMVNIERSSGRRTWHGCMGARPWPGLSIATAICHGSGMSAVHVHRTTLFDEEFCTPSGQTKILSRLQVIVKPSVDTQREKFGLLAATYPLCRSFMLKNDNGPEKETGLVCQ